MLKYSLVIPPWIARPSMGLVPPLQSRRALNLALPGTLRASANPLPADWPGIPYRNDARPFCNFINGTIY
jgi:hypothetical protein